jgi:malate dehydrogenase (oxaloacetate-decarboxylating)
VINGAGAAGLAVAELLVYAGFIDIDVCDTKGIIYQGRCVGMNSEKTRIAAFTNRQLKRGTLADVICGADVFVGVSTGGVVTEDMISSMATSPIVFAMANPIPEIMPEEAFSAGAVVVGTGRSDFPNQINNVLAFPGVFRGALDAQARDINKDMMIGAASALASLVTEENIAEGIILPDVFRRDVVPQVARAVNDIAKRTGALRSCG